MLLDSLRAARAYLQLPAAAKAEYRRDRSPQALGADPGIDASVRAALAWMARAQDRSATADGGVARHYSLVRGWAPSYPETTGYIVPTFIDAAGELGMPELRDRAARMLDWLVSIQLPGGGFQGGVIGQTPVVPVTFNTGQILIGLALGVTAFGDRYREATRGAAGWLLEIQDPDGCWRKGGTPFAAPGVKAYETHVAWGLFEAERVEPGRGYGEAGLRNVAWALRQQQANGWFENCCLTEPVAPLTHTLGYALRGVLEAHRLAGDPALLAAARRTADGLLTALDASGRIPGRLDAQWRGRVSWVCLTGQVQIAHCWLMLYEQTGDAKYWEAARRANAFVRRTVRLDGPEETRGGVKGSFPVDGAYGRFEYLNWAAKFFVDANLYEQRLLRAAA